MRALSPRPSAATQVPDAFRAVQDGSRRGQLPQCKRVHRGLPRNGDPLRTLLNIASWSHMTGTSHGPALSIALGCPGTPWAAARRRSSWSSCNLGAAAVGCCAALRRGTSRENSARDAHVTFLVGRGWLKEVGRASYSLSLRITSPPIAHSETGNPL
ncbi:hypothetical protein OBBRIDRAFT_462030 [Obba rivulosa]|uniref:Uncharacterized protein n=1 Tax=Obba rivulosa TaxID=1052685 RepID=A0A8E2DML6_9APHY|nr:hypothetical protein OBBRIDRAFT_462030 [Obba rivulosa]